MGFEFGELYFVSRTVGVNQSELQYGAVNDSAALGFRD
jgi:hypothetical protein